MNRRKSSWVRRRLPMIVAAAALVVLVLLIVLLAKGCSKKTDEAILAKAFSTEAQLGLPISATLNPGDFVSYGGYQFETKTKLDKMASLILKNNDGVTGTSYQNSYGKFWLFTKTNEAASGTDSWCLYQREPSVPNWYIYMAPYRQMTLPEGGSMDLLLPLHLITDTNLLDSMGRRVQTETVYTCGLNSLPQDQTLSSLFRGFYEESGLYTVSSSDKGFTLVPKGGSQELSFLFDEAGDGTGQFIITVPVSTEPEPTQTASVSYNGGEAQELSQTDALTLSALLLQASYKAAGAGAESYPYTVTAGEQTYEIALEWKSDAWQATVLSDQKTAVLPTRGSCTVAAIFTASGLEGMPKRETEKWPNGVSAEVTAMATCMTTTTDVNVRTAPSTNSSILMTMPKDAAVAVVGKCDSDWYEICYNDQLAYMSADYLQATYGSSDQPPAE